MGKIEANFFMSLDGVVESPDQWHFDYFNDEDGRSDRQGTERYSGFLMGRVLYEEWASYWPNQGDDLPFAPFINNIAKYVVSNSLSTRRLWNNTTLVSGDVATQLRQIKDASDRRHRDVRQRHAGAVAAGERAARRAPPDAPPDRGRPRKAALRGHTHLPLELVSHETFKNRRPEPLLRTRRAG